MRVRLAMRAMLSRAIARARVQEEDERWDSIRTVVRVAEAGRLAVAAVDKAGGRLPVDNLQRRAASDSRLRRVALALPRSRADSALRPPRVEASALLRSKGALALLRPRKVASALRRVASALRRLAPLELQRSRASALHRETWAWSPRVEASALRA
jgi:hypothetical protein